MSETYPTLNRSLVNKPAKTEKIIQFGTGAFLKGFINDIFQQLNDHGLYDGGIVAVKLRPGNAQQIEQINRQEGLFTINVRGVDNGKLVDNYRVIDVQNRALSPYDDVDGFMALADNPELEWIVSNTTEAGICFDEQQQFSDAPALGFPAKLTQLLYRRYQTFNGDSSKGVSVLCCELIENNAQVLLGYLKQYAQFWQLDAEFEHWLSQHCYFHNTLVDRIVTGRPPEPRVAEITQALNYTDAELIETESYYQWVIETNGRGEFLNRLFAESAGLNVILTDDLTSYRQRKVRILNGAHTGCVALAQLLGIETVYQATQTPMIKQFLQRLVFDEIVPTINQPRDEVSAYAQAIIERFENPFLFHAWQSIALNSVSKWSARLLPTLQDVVARSGKPSAGIATSMAAHLLLYGAQPKTPAQGPQDAPELIAKFQTAFETSPEDDFVSQILADTTLWGMDLTTVPGLVATVGDRIKQLKQQGVEAYLQRV